MIYRSHESHVGNARYRHGLICRGWMLSQNGNAQYFECKRYAQPNIDANYGP